MVHNPCEFSQKYDKLHSDFLSIHGPEQASGSCTRRKGFHSQATKQRLVLEAKDFIQHSMGKERKRIVWERKHHAIFLSPTVI